MNFIEEIVNRLCESRRLNEMAIINPQLCKSLPMQVEIEQSREGPIPHLHVYLDKTRNPRNCAYVRLDKAEYSSHHNKASSKIMTPDQKDAFIEVMTSIWNSQFIQSITSEEIRRATGYEAAVKLWIDTYGETVKFEYDSAGFPVMPDYKNL